MPWNMRAESAFNLQAWSPPKGRDRCRRDPDAGPGTCWFWWEGCPDGEKRGCFQMFAAAKLHCPNRTAPDARTDGPSEKEGDSAAT